MSSRNVVITIGFVSASFIMYKLIKRRLSSINSNIAKLSQQTNHLILHFDINKTIVMADKVQGKALKGVINDAISESSWGRVCSIDKCPSEYEYNEEFVIDKSIWMPSPPYEITPIQPNENVISFMSWIKACYPYPNGITNQEIKQKRRSFTLRFNELFDNKVNKISLPYIQRYNAMLNKMESGGEDGQPIFIVPAFWNCIHDLVRAKRSFSIIFRSFGTDNAEVMKEFNAFCRKYKYDGTDKDLPNLLLETQHIGAINCDQKNGQSLIVGVEGRNPMDRTKEIKNMELTELYKFDRMKWYFDEQREDKSINIMCDKQMIYDYIKEQSLQQKTMMFSDDYVWWSLHGENSDGGKVLILDENDNKNIHQIFFDDNLEFDRAGIVDVRDLSVDNGNVCLSDTIWNDLKSTHLLKVEPVEIMINDDYFAEKVITFETAFAKRKPNLS